MEPDKIQNTLLVLALIFLSSLHKLIAGLTVSIREAVKWREISICIKPVSNTRWCYQRGAPQGGMGGVPTIVSVCVCVQVLFSSHNESSDFQVQYVKFALNYDF